MRRNIILVIGLVIVIALLGVANEKWLNKSSQPEQPENEAPAQQSKQQPPKTPPLPQSMATKPVINPAEVAKMTKLPSGLRYEDVKIGKGAQPTSGATVVVHYTGWLMNGTKFDSSVDRGQPFEFSLGKGQVIKGWDEGLSTMKIGGKRRLVIPPSLGYGPAGSPPTIPPNSTLVFDVELLGVKPAK